MRNLDKLRGFMFFGGLLLIFGPLWGDTLIGTSHFTYLQRAVPGVVLVVVSVIWAIKVKSNVLNDTPVNIGEKLKK